MHRADVDSSPARLEKDENGAVVYPFWSAKQVKAKIYVTLKESETAKDKVIG